MLVPLVQELRAGVGTDAYPGGGGRTLLNLPSDLRLIPGGLLERKGKERERGEKRMERETVGEKGKA